MYVVDVCTSCTYINISSAIAASVSGDTINITAGIYTEPMSTINAGVALTLLYVLVSLNYHLFLLW